MVNGGNRPLVNGPIDVGRQLFVELFAFWVSRARRGQSGGYVAAGGPEFAGIRDD